MMNVRTVSYNYDKKPAAYGGGMEYGVHSSAKMTSNTNGNNNIYSTSILNDNEIEQLGIGKRDIDMDELKALLG